MRRYWLFVYLECYPSGGLNDFKKSFDSKPESQLHYLVNYSDDYFYHIFDSREMIVVGGNDKPEAFKK